MDARRDAGDGQLHDPTFLWAFLSALALDWRARVGRNAPSACTEDGRRAWEAFRAAQTAGGVLSRSPPQGGVVRGGHVACCTVCALGHARQVRAAKRDPRTRGDARVSRRARRSSGKSHCPRSIILLHILNLTANSQTLIRGRRRRRSWSHCGLSLALSCLVTEPERAWLRRRMPRAPERVNVPNGRRSAAHTRRRSPAR